MGELNAEEMFISLTIISTTYPDEGKDGSSHTKSEWLVQEGDLHSLFSQIHVTYSQLYLSLKRLITCF